MHTFNKALTLLASVLPLAAQAAAPQGLPADAKWLGEYRVTRIEMAAGKESPVSLCGADAEERDRECDARVAIVEIAGTNGPELLFLKPGSKSGSFESFMLHDSPSIAESFQQGRVANCERRAPDAGSLNRNFCRARRIASTSSGREAFYFHKKLSDSDYRQAEADLLKECGADRARADSLILPFLVGMSDSAYWVEREPSGATVLTRERDVSFMLIPIRVKTRYVLERTGL